MNIAIIGAGPLGCYAGYLLAQKGHQVSIYDQKKSIGEPIQCTGILTSDFDQFNIPLDSFLINIINRIKVFSDQNTTTIKQKDYIVCRKRFDNYLADLAKSAGVKIFINHSFLKKENHQLIIKNNNTAQDIIIEPEIVIAADGPLSPTAKAYGFYHPDRQNYFGIQAVVEGEFDPDVTETYFGTELCPDFFAWIVPESSTIARVGLAARNNQKCYFDHFLEKHHFSAKKVQAGIIPIFHPRQKLKQDNCYLLGDASSYVKATTGGGLIPGMKQAEILVDCLCHDKDYQKMIKPLRRKMLLHLQLRKMFNKFSDSDFNHLISYIDQPKVQKIFETHTRDNPFPLAVKTLLKEPRLLYFLKCLF